MTLVPRDPIPGHPLIFRIDTRNGRHADFWCKVRLAFLPRLRGHCFWATDIPGDLLKGMEGRSVVILPRPLLLQYQPEFVRLSAKEREHIQQYCLERKKGYVRNQEVAHQLKVAGLVRGRTVTTKGYSSYHLSP